MNIRYGEPLSNGWMRMKKALFNPFDIGKWFLIGFTAFLAGLADGPGMGGNFSYSRGKENLNFKKLADFPNTAWEWLSNHPFWLMLIIFGVLFIIVLGIVLLWLSSRGKFMFLDNVVHNRALVTMPWNQFKELGNSLFLWRFFFGIIMFTIFCLFTIVAFAFGFYIYRHDLSGLAIGLLIAGMVLLFFLLFIIGGYITLFLHHFIVPVMYKNNTGAVQAWRLFMPLLTRYLLYFILYGLLIFLLYIVVFVCVMIIGLFTCCIGFILLAIPYLGTVLMLPVLYTFRTIGLEFLEQFGPEYEIFPRPGINDINGVYEL